MAEVKTTAIAAFADELRSWRQHFGWSQAELAGKIAYSPSLVSGVETLAKTPALDFAKRCDQAFGTPGTLTRLQELVVREAYPSWFAPVVGFEREAVRLHGWELGAVPGLLQTEDYARAVIRAGRPQDTAEAVDRTVAARMERQEALNGDSTPMLWYVLGEGALRHQAGGADVMAAQLDKLITKAGEPGIVIQVLPFTATDHAGADGPISVYEFADAPTVAYTECYGGGRIVEAHDEVADLMTVVSVIRASALSPPESARLMREIRSEIGGN